MKRYKNIRQSARKFKLTLDDFTPSDLRDDLLYNEFIDSLQEEIENSNLAQSTLDGYLGYLTGKVMLYGGGVYPACWDKDDDMLVRAPGLEPGTP